MERRSFLKFLGLSSSIGLVKGSLAQSAILPLNSTRLSNIPYSGIDSSDIDDVVLSPELKYSILIKWGDPLSKSDYFGFNNDYINFTPIDKFGNEGLLWVNHEYCDRFTIKDKTLVSKQNVDNEMYSVGGSIIHVKRTNGSWSYIPNSSYNRRITAQTEIPFANSVQIKGAHSAIGTLGNCAGGKTPWNTILTCEENYDLFFGETAYGPNKSNHHIDSYLGWEKYYNYPPEHYGWVVEINPFSGEAKKHTSMGRFAHECATTIQTSDDKCVVYTGDDSAGEHIYKFISNSKDSLDTGDLYVANIKTGKWLLLDINKNPLLKDKFSSQLELLIRTREAAKFLGATPMDRPEDIEIHPRTKDVYISLTNNKVVSNFHGSILKLSEDNADPSSLSFSSETFLTGGKDTGFSCPDNLAFDDKENLWFTSDISGYSMKSDKYSSFKNNGLFVVSASGKTAGSVIQVASAPNNAEFTGPCFSPDFSSLFLTLLIVFLLK